MMGKKIVSLPGDGIGPEVVSSAVKVIRETARLFSVDIEMEQELIGGCAYNKNGEPLSGSVIDKCSNADAVLLGAVGGPEWENLPHHIKPEAALLKLRKSLGLLANIRPARFYKSLLKSSPLKDEIAADAGFIVIRELTGGVYFGRPRGFNEERGWNTMEYSHSEVERIARYAFEVAKKRKGKLVSVDKANVLECSQFWRNTVEEVHKSYPGVELSHMYVDNAAMQIVSRPSYFDVILTSNLFGDILSDISGAVTGSLGMLPSASMGEVCALYEPIHGSAPDIAGKGIANPIGTIASAAMMFERSFGLKEAALVIEEAIELALLKGYRTRDIYSEGCVLAGTETMAEEITKCIYEVYEKHNAELITN
jgi:3-isopropylmalate dehydrogenase